MAWRFSHAITWKKNCFYFFAAAIVAHCHTRSVAFHRIFFLFISHLTINRTLAIYLSSNISSLTWEYDLIWENDHMWSTLFFFIIHTSDNVGSLRQVFVIFRSKSAVFFNLLDFSDEKSGKIEKSRFLIRVLYACSCKLVYMQVFSAHSMLTDVFVNKQQFYKSQAKWLIFDLNHSTEEKLKLPHKQLFQSMIWKRKFIKPFNKA